mmetsp:Transcript_13528/g.34124  ORF Transcript_13528/g.34124 Transcript_13528/m.34124 type:complete len:261 (+) Transcript_13528:199-981(+)
MSRCCPVHTGGTPAMAPPTPTSAMREDSASVRWFHALAMTTLLAARSPAARVAWNSASFTTSDTPAAAAATHSGPSIGPAAPETTLRAASRDAYPMPAPVTASSPPTPSDPIVSRRPWPYGWSASLGFRAASIDHRVMPSDTRSDRDATPSAMSAVLPLTYPAAVFRAAKPTLQPAPTLVMRPAWSRFSRVEALPVSPAGCGPSIGGQESLKARQSGPPHPRPSSSRPPRAGLPAAARDGSWQPLRFRVGAAATDASNRR